MLMSNMLEQAIIDAAALREAALKNAEQSIIEKYAPQIKKAVAEMLDDTLKETKIYNGRTVEVVHEADGDGNVTVKESDGKPFMVKESELSEASQEDILQEQEAEAAMDTTTSPVDIEAPQAWDSRVSETQPISLSALIDAADENGDIEIDLDSIELALSQQQAEDPIQDPLGDLLATPDEEQGDEPTPDEEAGEEDILGDLDDETEDFQLQEIVSAIKNILDEEIEVDMAADKSGSIDTAKGELKYEAEKQAAHDAHHDDDEEDEEEKEENEKLQEALKEN
jgi:hypothetical protein